MPTPLHSKESVAGCRTVSRSESSGRHRPAVQHQGHRHRRAQIKTSHQRRGAESGFAARKSVGSSFVGPVKGRMSDGVIHAGGFKTGSVQDGDDVAGSGAFKVLITLGGCVVEKTVGGVGQKSLGLHFRVDRLGENVIEGQAKDKRTQIVDAGDAADSYVQKCLRH